MIDPNKYPTKIEATDANIFLNDDVHDTNGIPLITISISGRNAVFAKQLATTFDGKTEAKELLRRLRDSGVYEEGEGWLDVSKEDIDKLQRWEKTTFGKSSISKLLSPVSPNGASIIFEEAAIWLLARSNTQHGKEFSKFLVRTFLDIRDGHYIAAEGNERIKARLQYSASEVELRDTVFNRGFQNIGYFMVQGDMAFYGGLTTEQVKMRKNIPKDRPIADFDSSIELTAKTLAKKTTEYNIKQKNLRGHAMQFEYKDNNDAMRTFLGKSGIKPEDTPKEIDIKIAQREARKQLQEEAKKGGVKKIL